MQKKYFHLGKAFYLITFCGLCLINIPALAIKTTGRITLGGVAITERFNSQEFGSSSNDYMLGSARLFYKISELGEDHWELISDLRDRHDFFGKLNKEQLQLEGKNDFQVRQMSARWLNPKGNSSATLGRFQLPEAGAVFVDGAEYEYRISSPWKAGFFGGYNPKSVENSYLQLNTDAVQDGLFLTYQSKDEDWDKNLFFSHGLVQQKYKSQDERSFFFHNLIYQWKDDSRLISFLNYDFVPSGKIQTMNLLYQQKWSQAFSSELGHLVIDVLEYRRNQGVLEKLDASPYSESHAQINTKLGQHSEVALELSSGLRQADNLKRDEASLGYSMNEVFSKNMDMRLKLGSRKNFTSQDTFSKLSLGYFSRKWEYSFDAQYEIDKNDDTSITHPLTLELALTNYYSKEIFLTGSFQRAADENVTIMSTFVKLGYRFGNQEIPPIRDGAPPRGPL